MKILRFVKGAERLYRQLEKSALIKKVIVAKPNWRSGTSAKKARLNLCNCGFRLNIGSTDGHQDFTIMPAGASKDMCQKNVVQILLKEGFEMSEKAIDRVETKDIIPYVPIQKQNVFQTVQGCNLETTRICSDNGTVLRRRNMMEENNNAKVVELFREKSDNSNLSGSGNGEEIMRKDVKRDKEGDVSVKKTKSEEKRYEEMNRDERCRNAYDYLLEKAVERNQFLEDGAPYLDDVFTLLRGKYGKDEGFRLYEGLNRTRGWIQPVMDLPIKVGKSKKRFRLIVDVPKDVIKKGPRKKMENLPTQKSVKTKEKELEVSKLFSFSVQEIAKWIICKEDGTLFSEEEMKERSMGVKKVIEEIQKKLIKVEEFVEHALFITALQK